MSSSSFSLESATLLLQPPTPRHWPHTGEHSKLCLWQLHLAVLQSVVHLHLMMLSRSSGDGGRSVITGSWFTSVVFQIADAQPLMYVQVYASKVDGSVWGRMRALLVATLLLNFEYLRTSRLSPSFLSYRPTSAASLASATSSIVASCLLNWRALSRKNKFDVIILRYNAFRRLVWCFGHANYRKRSACQCQIGHMHIVTQLTFRITITYNQLSTVRHWLPYFANWTKPKWPMLALFPTLWANIYTRNIHPT